MSVIVGQIQEISKRGNATNIKVNGQWIGCGFNGVPANQGDQVQFGTVQNGQYLNADMNNFQVLSAGSSQPQQQHAPQQQRQAAPQRPRAGGNPSAGGGKDDYWAKKEERDVITQQVIQLQASRNAAIAVCSSALAANILPVPAKKADAFDAFLAAVDEVTQRYEANTAAKRAGNDAFADASGAVDADDDYS